MVDPNPRLYTLSTEIVLQPKQKNGCSVMMRNSKNITHHLTDFKFFKHFIKLRIKFNLSVLVSVK